MTARAAIGVSPGVFFGVLLIALATAPLAPAGAAAPLFETDTELALRIEAPFRAIERDTDEREEHAGVLRHRTDAGDEHVFDVEVRVRGKSRLEFCDFPPLRVDFDRDALAGTVFAGQNHLKLVTLCRETRSHREHLAQEYQIYRAFNALTNLSFRVRPATVEYVVTDSRRGETFTAPAFFIEEDWEVAERHGLTALDLPEVPVARLDTEHAALLALFQYLIANTDWSATTAAPDEDCCHNTRPIGTADGPVMLLPYDFDHAGLIGAAYARPRSHLPIRSVRQRLYRGHCATNDALDPAVQRFNVVRAQIEQIFDTLPETLDARTRIRTLDYIAEFYDVINDPAELQEAVHEACR